MSYVIGDERFTIDAPFVVRILPANTPHTFLNAGSHSIHVLGVFATPTGGQIEMLGPNPLRPGE